jgi:hypothetical protein
LQTRERVLGKIDTDSHEPSIGTAGWAEATGGECSRLNPSVL